MQIILSEEEIITIHEALCEKRAYIASQILWEKDPEKLIVDTIRAKLLKEDYENIDNMIRRFEPYVKIM